MAILNAMQLKNGATTKTNIVGDFTQPVQFLPEKNKTEEWIAQCVDWYEKEGLKQVQKQARKFMKNAKLAEGIIDKSDYIVEEDNEVAELIDTLTEEDESAFELKFYPIIPNVINILTGEFAKRTEKLTYRATDETSYNELLEEKSSMVEQVLMQYAESKMMETIESMGLDFQNEEQLQQAQEMMSEDNLKQLPEIEKFFKKSYRSMIEEWAMHQHQVDEERFYIRELEQVAFKESLIYNREIWHFVMREDDYDIELWNPIFTFYHKSPEAQYISQSNFAGRFNLLTIPDVIDKYGYLMTEEQLRSLEELYPIKNINYIDGGVGNDGSMYDASRSHEWNTQGPSLGMRQHKAFEELMGTSSDNLMDVILNEKGDIFSQEQYVRETIVYWKSQRKVGHLTSIDERGVLINMIVDEHYKVTVKPEYDTLVYKEKKRETLIYGEHIDWIWINQAYGAVKLGPNRLSHYGNSGEDRIKPIYLNTGPVQYQFKGDFSLYGCKLPVEGADFGNRNTRSVSLVDRMKPYQIGYNLVNNQISDILIDELGTIIVLDQNAIPQNSMGEDWGKNNFEKAYVAMKDFSMLPLDTSIQNTETPMNFQHYQKLDLEQTNRLMSRIQLANYFKQQCFENIGITPQRVGNVTSQETATGVQTAVNQSYAQTEQYFMQHSEHLMPRVHQMRTDLAQYYHSKNPSLRLQYITAMDERVNFAINGTELLLRELNIFATTKINHKFILEQLKQMTIQNNTAGASIYDLGNIMKSESLAQVDHVLKDIDQKSNAIRQQEQAHQEEMERARIEHENELRAREEQFEAAENEKDRESNERVAEIRAAGIAAMAEGQGQSMDEYKDAMDRIDKKEIAQSKVNVEKEREANKRDIERDKIQLKREEILAKKEVANKQLEIAKTNKNKWDFKPKSQERK